MGAGGGVGTTAAQLFNNDAFDDDEGFGDTSSNNQIRGGSGGPGTLNQRPIIPEILGSGGAQPMDDEEDDYLEVDDDGEVDENDDDHEDDYDH